MTKREANLKRRERVITETEVHINKRLTDLREKEVQVEAQRTAINFVTRCFDKMYGAVDCVQLNFQTRTDQILSNRKSV